MSESEEEMLSRLNGMAKGGATWDLSENDMNAIGWALNIVESRDTLPVAEPVAERRKGDILCKHCNTWQTPKTTPDCPNCGKQLYT